MSSNRKRDARFLSALNVLATACSLSLCVVAFVLMPPRSHHGQHFSLYWKLGVVLSVSQSAPACLLGAGTAAEREHKVFNFFRPCSSPSERVQETPMGRAGGIDTWHATESGAVCPAGSGAAVVLPAHLKGSSWVILVITVPELWGEIKFMNFWLHHSRNVPTRAVTLITKYLSTFRRGPHPLDC